jgi:sorbitol-6-phosphate 2-dehydrogenase
MGAGRQVDPRRIAAVRGATWNGRRCLTLRRVDGTGTGSAAETTLAIGSEASDPAAIAAAYRTYLDRNGAHPARIELDSVPFLPGTAADALGVAGEVGSSSRGGDADPVIAAVKSRAGVMTDRVAIVTGGAQGFGFEIARGLAAAGAQVVLADLNGDGAAEAAQRLNEQSQRGAHSAVAVNVADEASVEAMFAEVVSRYGGFDLVVSNAGVLKAGSVKELSAGDFNFVTSVNYTGFFLVTKHAARILEAQNAAAVAALPEQPLYTDIIEINSKSGLAGSNKNGAYAGSKFGGIGLVQSFAMELVEDNVKVNAICPGNFFDGPLWSDPDRGLFVQYLRAGKVPGAETIADVRRSYEQRVPMKRGASGADVVKAILYVVEQVYETGQAVPVTGGQEMLR